MELSPDQAALLRARFDECGKLLAGGNLDLHYARQQALQHEMIAGHGVAGLRLWLELSKHEFLERAGLFEPGVVPPGCPWDFVNELATADAIARVFEPVQPLIPEAVRLLQQCCCLLVPARLDNGRWVLLYGLDIAAVNERGYKFQLWAGGEPWTDPASDVAAGLPTGWEVPDALASWYRIHNGFGAFECPHWIWISTCIVPGDDLDTLDTSTPTGPPGAVQSCDGRDLLLFSRDGFGNGQCFLRESSADRSPTNTVWFEHAPPSIGRPEPFHDYLQRFIMWELAGQR